MGDLNNYDIAACVNEIESACRYFVSGFTCLKVLNQEGLVRLSDEDLLFNITNLVFDYGASKIAHVRKNNELHIGMQHVTAHNLKFSLIPFSKREFLSLTCGGISILSI